MKKIEATLSEMDTASLQLTSALLSGCFRGQDLSKYTSSANKDLAYALHISDSIAHHYAVYVMSQTREGKGQFRRDAQEARKEMNRRRNKINRYHMQVMRLLFANKETLTHITKRPFVTTGVSSAMAIAGGIREALPILVEHLYSYKGTIESIFLKPIVDWLVEMAWGITKVSRYRESLPEENFFFKKGRRFIDKHYPTQRDIQWQPAPNPTYGKLPKDISGIFKHQFVDITAKQPDDFELRLKKGGLLCIGGTLHRAKKEFILYRNEGVIVKREDNQSLNIEDIEPA